MSKYLTICCLCIYSLLLSSCYSYGPTHKPYEINKKSKEYKHQYIQSTFEEAKNIITEAEITLVNDSIKFLFPNDIQFKTSKYIPHSKYKSPLDKLAGLLLRHNETEILITGFSDNTGTVSFNKKISKKRANFVKEYLMFNKIKESRIETWGLGDILPIADNNTEEGRSLNRRVEFIVLYRD